MRDVAGIVCLLLAGAAAGCLDTSPDQGEDLDARLREMKHLTLDRVVLQELDWLTIREDETLVLRHSDLEIHGHLLVEGTLLIEDSTLRFGNPDDAQRYDRWGWGIGGKVWAKSSRIIGPSEIEVVDGLLTMTGMDNVIVTRGIFGLGSKIELENTTVEFHGEADTPRGGRRVVLEDGASLNATDSILGGDYWAGEACTVQFLHTSVGFLAMGGPGRYEMLYRLQVNVRDLADDPVVNATVRTQSAVTLSNDDQGLTDAAGSTHLLQFAFTQEGGTLLAHDPHMVFINGMLMGSSVAALGDDVLNVRYPV